MRLFLIEDDRKLRLELTCFLQKYGYDCAFSDDFENMKETALLADADLILLDLNLPFGDGYQLCREIRMASDVPVIVVTSQNSDMDELMCMRLGADDFVAKPYNAQILLARIEAVLRRKNQSGRDTRLKYRGLCYDAERGIAAFETHETELTKNEGKILSLLIRQEGKIISRSELMDALWQSDLFVDDNTLTVNVNRLRKKLSGIGLEDFIKTKHGQGYSL